MAPVLHAIPSSFRMSMQTTQKQTCSSHSLVQNRPTRTLGWQLPDTSSNRSGNDVAYGILQGCSLQRLGVPSAQ